MQDRQTPEVERDATSGPFEWDGFIGPPETETSRCAEEAQRARTRLDMSGPADAQTLQKGLIPMTLSRPSMT